ncbi:MAG: ribosome recycling factor [Candidatus Dependentiae bacterium]|nr:ribosome recycling factor [Candidatus Dependentiae bacterium]
MNIKDIVLVENDIKSFETPMKLEMEKPLKHFDGELAKIRTGRAHTSLIEDIQISTYGQNPMPLKNLAALSAPDARNIVIQPWDAAIIGDIEKALKASNIGISPANDGAVIRLQLPEISSARRDDLAKVLGKKLEECRVAVRNIRKDFNNLLRDAKKDKEISENFFSRLGDVLQKVTDTYIEQAEKKAAAKEKDIKSV